MELTEEPNQPPAQARPRAAHGSSLTCGEKHPMNRSIKNLAFGLVALLAALALSAASSPPESPTNEESILHASEVYLIRSRQVGGDLHYYVEAVWRHAPKAGAAPAVGSEFTGTVLKDAEIITFIFNPRLHAKIGRRGVQVINGNVPSFQMSVDDLRAMIQSTAWVPSPSSP